MHAVSIHCNTFDQACPSQLQRLMLTYVCTTWRRPNVSPLHALSHGRTVDEFMEETSGWRPPVSSGIVMAVVWVCFHNFRRLQSVTGDGSVSIFHHSPTVGTGCVCVQRHVSFCPTFHWMRRSIHSGYTGYWVPVASHGQCLCKPGESLGVNLAYNGSRKVCQM